MTIDNIRYHLSRWIVGRLRHNTVEGVVSQLKQGSNSPRTPQIVRRPEAREHSARQQGNEQRHPFLVGCRNKMSPLSGQRGCMGI